VCRFVYRRKCSIVRLLNNSSVPQTSGVIGLYVEGSGVELTYSFCIYLNELRETTKTSVIIAGIPAEIPTRHLTNVGIGPYLLSVVADAVKA
jgi:ABC-type lipoprotein release transport system permease subunit